MTVLTKDNFKIVLNEGDPTPIFLGLLKRQNGTVDAMLIFPKEAEGMQAFYYPQGRFYRSYREVRKPNPSLSLCLEQAKMALEASDRMIYFFEKRDHRITLSDGTRFGTVIFRVDRSFIFDQKYVQFGANPYQSVGLNCLPNELGRFAGVPARAEHPAP